MHVNISIKNVDGIVKNKLCTGCGCCSGVCPSTAINMKIDKYGIVVPSIHSDKCIQCGLCLSVCSGKGFDYNYYMNKIYGKLPDDVAIGPMINAYAGRCKEKSVLEIAQSGGIVSTILIYGIENKLFEGAVVTGYRKGREPLTPEAYIATNRDEILNAVGSKYCSVPVSSMIRDIMEADGRYAFVGTPCQIQSMRKAEQVIPNLEQKISLYIGLHCNSIYNAYYLEQVLSLARLNKHNIKSFQYRAKAENENEPASDLFFETKKGEALRFDGTAFRANLRPYFTNWRCQLCFDKLNEFSDISCGDCRIKAHYENQTANDIKAALSDVIVRTDRGENVINHMITDGLLTMYQSKSADIVKSSKVKDKKIGVRYANQINKYFHHQIPDYGLEFVFADESSPKKVFDLFMSLSMCQYYLCHTLNRYKWFRSFLKCIPNNILGLINRINYGLTMRRKDYKGKGIKLTVKG